MGRIAFATCLGREQLTPGDEEVLQILAQRGHDMAVAVWDDGAVRWDDFDLVVIRSTWDYSRKASAFRKWLQGLAAGGTPTCNDIDLMLANMDKRYLHDLAKQGIDMPRTVFVPPGDGRTLGDVAAVFSGGPVVIKPCVSASADDTFLARTHKDLGSLEGTWQGLVATRAMIVQEYCPEVAQVGEWSLMFFAGRYSHAVLKRPRSGDFRVQAEHGGSLEAARPADAMIAAAEAIVAKAAGDATYARVDLIERQGRFLLMELELIEPQLFCSYAPGSAVRFADAIEAHGVGGA